MPLKILYYGTEPSKNQLKKSGDGWEKGTAEIHMAKRNGEGNGTSRTKMERSGNEFTKPCPVEKS